MSAQRHPNIINFPTAATTDDRQQMQDLGIGQFVGQQSGYVIMPPQAQAPTPTATPSIDMGTACVMAAVAAVVTGVVIYQSPDQAAQRQVQQQILELQQREQASSQFIQTTRNFCQGVTSQ